ncbi:MAG: hypothetical protein KF878_09615 [Planctomycetes bacterium]|nr:hypothetical protein [Planctomycetota bacterium]
MDVADRVSATVTRIEDHGVYLAADGEEILVLLPYLAWITPVDPRTIASLGQAMDVLITRRIGPGQLMGSVKDLQPELDPWRDPTVVAVSTTHTATVVQQLPFGVALHLGGGANALLRPPDPSLQIGERIQVVVEEVDPIRRVLGVKRKH